MTDEKPRSVLAQKALKQKAERDARQAAATKNAADIADRVKRAASKWLELQEIYPDVVKEFSDDLIGTGTTLGYGVAQKPRDSLLGTLTVTVKREGASLNFQTRSIEVYQGGRISAKNIFARGEVPENDEVTLEDADREWLRQSLEAYLHRALA